MSRRRTVYISAFKTRLVLEVLKEEQIAYIKKIEIEDEMEYFSSKLKEDDPIMKTASGATLNRSNAYTIVNRIYN